MTTPSALLEDVAPHEPARGNSRVLPGPTLAKSGALLLLACGGVLAWWGGPWGLAGAALVAAAAGWVGTAQAGTHAQQAAAGATAVGPASATRKTPSGSGRVGAEVMVETVVPVWSRQMDVTRESAAEGLAQLLNAFAEMSGALQALTDNLNAHQVSAEPGAVGQAVQREAPALQVLTAASARAFAERDTAVACLGACAQGLQELGDLAKRARELARHTRLVAFNASIEANRNRTRDDGGSQAVATEARMLAASMAETGEKIQRVVQGLLQTVSTAQRSGDLKNTSQEELRLEIDLHARQALTALLGSLGSALKNSTEVHQAGQTLKEQLDQAFVHFQFGDRVSQMLSIVGNDMSNFAQWVAANPRATQTDAAEWLAALEASYTMEEQRSSHHGNVHVQQGSGVEFF